MQCEREHYEPWGYAVKRVTKESIDRLKSSFRLEDYIRTTVDLKRSGGFYQGKCPFHSDDSPSFTVYPDHYFCFGCKKQGDAISFCMESDGLRFHEAVETVASRMGVSLEYEDERAISPEQEERERSRKEAVYIVNEVSELYHRVLLSHEGERARDYLSKRGYGLERLRQFRVGLALNENIVCEEARRRGWSFERLERLSLVSPSMRMQGEHYDFFRDRVLIPIGDERGNVVAFGGRTYLPPPPHLERKPPKYLNSRESDLFSKSFTVFNLHRARGEIARSGQALLVEGFFDCLSLYANGIENVVAALSTSITPQHLDRLATLARARELVVSFDSDDAGQNATLGFFRKVFPLGRFGLRYLALPDGKDPDEFIRGHGKDAFSQLIAASQPLMNKVCEIACQKIAVNDVERRLAAVREKILPAISEHPDPATRDLALQSVASFLRLSDHRFLIPGHVPVQTVASPTSVKPTQVVPVSFVKQAAQAPVSQGSPRVGAVKEDSGQPPGPQWKATPAEVKFVCNLLQAERADLPVRLRVLFEGSEVEGDDEALRVEVCGETLTHSLSEASKELVRDLLHVQHSLGGRSILWAQDERDLGDTAANLRILLALARGDDGSLERLGAASLVKGASIGQGKSLRSVRAGADHANAFAPPLLATLRLALRDAECSSRQGSLKSGLERILTGLEKDFLVSRWRAESRRCAELGPHETQARLEAENFLKRAEETLALMEERESRKKTRDEVGGLR